MSISPNYCNAYSKETENALLPIQRLFDNDKLKTIKVKTRFELQNMKKSTYYEANPYDEIPPPRYTKGDYANLLLCYQRAMGEVTIQGKDAQFLKIALKVTFKNKNGQMKKISMVITPGLIHYDLYYKR